MIECVFTVDVQAITQREELSSNIEKARRERPRLLMEYSRIRRRSLPLTSYVDLQVTEAELLDTLD